MMKKKDFERFVGWEESLLDAYIFDRVEFVSRTDDAMFFDIVDDGDKREVKVEYDGTAYWRLADTEEWLYMDTLR